MVVITELCDKTCGLDARAGSYGQGIVLSTKALKEQKTSKRVFPVFFYNLRLYLDKNLKNPHVSMVGLIVLIRFRVTNFPLRASSQIKNIDLESLSFTEPSHTL